MSNVGDLDRNRVAGRAGGDNESLDLQLCPVPSERRDLQKLFMIDAGRHEPDRRTHDLGLFSPGPDVEPLVLKQRSAGDGRPDESAGRPIVFAGTTSDDRQDEDQPGLSAALPRGLLFGCSFAAILWAIVAALVMLFVR